MRNKTNVVVVLPYAENYDYQYGGAIAHWVHAVMEASKLNYQIFSCSSYSNMGKTETSYYGHFLSLIKKMDYKLSQNFLVERFFFLFRKFFCRDVFFIFSIYYKIKNIRTIIIHNRPLSALLIRRLGFKGKIILHMHNSHFVNLSCKRWQQCNTSCDAIVYCSKFLLRQGVKHAKYEATYSTVVYNGVQDDIFQLSNPENNIEKRSENIIFAGRLIPDKGLHFLIPAFANFSRKHKSYKLLVFGSSGSGNVQKITEYERELRQLARFHSVEDKVKFCGHIGQRELIEVFKENEVVVVPSVWEEPFGMVALEAMSCGCKVIATRRGGMPEFLNVNTILVEPDIKAIQDGLEGSVLMKTKPVDVNRFLWKNITDDYVKVINIRK
ncbi:glycosyltransferase family 4 protein [Ascidiaceihabitans sp.]|nr:glycosyltransferase family 4 protein [Ascidiaceihabitans sp.]